MQASLKEYSRFDDSLIKRNQPATLDKSTNMVRRDSFLGHNCVYISAMRVHKP